MLILKHGVFCLPNVEQAVIDPSSSCLSFFGSNTTSSGRQRIATHKCRHKEADSLNMLRVMQSGTLEGSKKLESGLYLVSKWVPNATNLNSWAIYPVLRETWFSSVKLQKNFLNCSHVINALLTPFKKKKKTCKTTTASLSFRMQCPLLQNNTEKVSRAFIFLI